jgi:hypothetical protein
MSFFQSKTKIRLILLFSYFEHKKSPQIENLNIFLKNRDV